MKLDDKTDLSSSAIYFISCCFNPVAMRCGNEALMQSTTSTGSSLPSKSLDFNQRV
ncbi:hypothetical protein GALMADRAFT_259382 [Galerina marginata CBS 339.88]|uniref:Uncharacterized protein n=1 Tax=Galerina marginata (strain CBS 339.88) TaxID=685588 RepID=A0A067S694_GALM3|nr:hypothetical protein GALMADRAFT_259382 [Galerina marginata CBS 339.88]